MNDLSQTGRPSMGRSAAAPARGRTYTIATQCSEPVSGSKTFVAKGSAQPIEKSQFGKGNPRKNKPFSLIFFGRPLLNLAGFGIRLGLGFGLSHCAIHRGAQLESGRGQRDRAIRFFSPDLYRKPQSMAGLASSNGDARTPWGKPPTKCWLAFAVQVTRV